jgi:addiction module HigA family antidote
LVEWTACKCAAGKPKESRIFLRLGLDTVSRVEMAREIRFCAHGVLSGVVALAGFTEPEIAQEWALRCFARRVTGWRPSTTRCAMIKMFTEIGPMTPVVHPGRLLKRELAARKLSANRLSLDIGVPSGRITDILNGRRAITADNAVRFGRYFGNSAQFWLDLQGQYDIGMVEREKGAEITRRVRPADAA